MAEMIPHDVARTLDMLDQPGTVTPLRFRQGEQTAQLMRAQQFTGEAVGIAKLEAAQKGTPSGLQTRAVRTTQK